jgi:hypothetical protein
MHTTAFALAPGSPVSVSSPTTNRARPANPKTAARCPACATATGGDLALLGDVELVLRGS